MRSVAVEWKDGSPEGCLKITNGKLEGLVVSKGEGETRGEKFCFVSNSSCRLEVMVVEENLSAGPDASIIHVLTKINPFSFFLRDVDDEYPVLIPAYGVSVTEVDDERSYVQIEQAVRGLGLQNRLQQIESEPEESYDEAAAETRKLPRPPIWMGLSRDMRIFEVTFPAVYMEVVVQSKFHGNQAPLPEADEKPVSYSFAFGRGAGCIEKTSRRLEEGVLPILHGKIVDDDVNYNFVAFVS